MTLQLQTLGFIGCGNMGEAMLRGYLEQSNLDPSHIHVYVPTESRRQQLVERYQIQAAASAPEAVREADLVVLAIKPMLYESVIREIRTELKPQAIVLSVTPAYTLEALKRLVVRDDIHVVRSMPNTAAAIGQGVTALVEDPELPDEALALVQSFADSFSTIVTVREDQMAAVSSLTGSSPAFLAMVMEALGEGAIGLGLPASTAYPLAARAMLGVAALALRSGDHPAKMRDAVCSAGGTSIEGVRVLEHGFKGQLIEAMVASSERFTELEAEMSELKEEDNDRTRDRF